MYVFGNICCIILFSSLGPIYIEPLLTTNPEVVVDKYLGSLLLVSPLNMGLSLIAVVMDPDICPSVQWIFNGTNIPTTEFMVTVNDPCDGVSPYEYQISIPSLTQMTSGFYSAIFDDGLTEPTVQPKVFVTVPGIIIEQTTRYKCMLINIPKLNLVLLYISPRKLYSFVNRIHSSGN